MRALDQFDLTVAEGTSTAVMGPSGCGKSTLLALLAGLAVPTSGTVTIGGTCVSSMDERQRLAFRRRSVGMVYQADNLLPHLTVEENVGLARSIRRSGTWRNRSAEPGDAPDRRTFDPTELLERLGIGPLRERLPDQLSGGQRQRVAVARAVVHRPAVILADEPTGSLDAETGAAVIALLVEAQRSIGATMVVVTHDRSAAAPLDAVVAMSRATGLVGSS